MKRTNLILIAIIVLALFLRLHLLNERQFGTDEDHSLEFARDMVTGKMDVVLATEPHPPGYYLFLGLLTKIDDSVFFLRLVNVFLAVLGIVTSYFLVKELTKSTETGLLSSFLLTLNPLQLVYAQQLRSYILLSLFYLLSMWSLYRYISTKEKKMIYPLTIRYILAFHIHFYTGFLMATHCLTILYFRKT